MGRPVTLCTAQWADMPLTELAAKASAWGYDGLELACWGDHFDIERGATDPSYCQGQKAILQRHGLKVWSISAHLQGQLVLDPNDRRSNGFAPDELANHPERIREWGLRQMSQAPQAARNLGVDVVNGFTGSSIWHLIYSFPPVEPAMIEDGFALFAERWNPILDEFANHDVRFALEVHPTEIAFDLYSAERAVEALAGRPEFGFNLDPSHLIWQGVDPALFARHFADRIYHTHVKDAKLNRDGKAGILSSYLPFGDWRRGWDFVSPGHGDINFDSLIRALNDIGYQGPLSVEWEDSGMDREFGAREAAAFVRRVDFTPSTQAFDAAFGEG